MQQSRISCSTLEEVSWLIGPAGSYTDSLAVFRFQLTDNKPISPHLISLLQPDEIQRAERYHKQADRQRFAYARVILRILSGLYTNQSPDRVKFIAGTNKKPVLLNTEGWCVNVSHAGDWILIIIGQVQVGIDVEKINPAFSFQDLLPASFSPQEQHYINTGTRAWYRFYQLWTRKEALVKATGKGIDEQFDRIPSLTGQHDIESSLIGEAGDWLVTSFNITPEYTAAIAYQQTLCIPKFYTLNSVLFDHSESKWKS